MNVFFPSFFSSRQSSGIQSGVEAQRKFIFIKKISNKNVFQLLFFITTREKALSTISWMFSGGEKRTSEPRNRAGCSISQRLVCILSQADATKGPKRWC